MESQTMWYVLPILGGAAQILQSGVNGALASRVGTPITAAFISFAIGTLLLGAAVAVGRLWVPVPVIRAAPWWVWVGGVLGAVSISLLAASAPRIGAGMTSALVLAGQVSLGAMLDQFGLAGFSPHPMTLLRGTGLLLIAAGVVALKAN
jgi:bacterial/archaeal transporter family-2 protein